MLKAEFLRDKFATALNYEKYLLTGTDEHRRRWQQVYDKTQLTEPQRSLLGSFTRQMNLLIVSGIWCGDCVQQVPLIQRIAEAKSDRIDLRILDRDEHKDLSAQLRLNAGDRVPVVILMAEDHEFCGLAGDRTLVRYRAIAQRQLGASCPTGIVPPDQDELALTVQDWVNEVERVQLMLRISPRLRKKYGD